MLWDFLKSKTLTIWNIYLLDKTALLQQSATWSRHANHGYKNHILSYSITMHLMKYCNVKSDILIFCWIPSKSWPVIPGKLLFMVSKWFILVHLHCTVVKYLSCLIIMNFKHVLWIFAATVSIQYLFLSGMVLHNHTVCHQV